MIEEKGGNRPQCVQDVRTALDDPHLDAISVATCNHWHCLAAIWAMEAGKDVVCEKPMCRFISEGRAVADADRHRHREGGDHRRVRTPVKPREDQQQNERVCETRDDEHELRPRHGKRHERHQGDDRNQEPAEASDSGAA